MKNARGFSLLELIISMAVLILLGSVAWHSYQSLTRRAYYTQLTQLLAPYKQSVAECFTLHKSLLLCDSGKNNIPAVTKAPLAGQANITVKNGMITLVPVAHQGIRATDVYILIPTEDDKHQIQWQASGPAMDKGYVRPTS